MNPGADRMDVDGEDRARVGPAQDGVIQYILGAVNDIRARLRQLEERQRVETRQETRVEDLIKANHSLEKKVQKLEDQMAHLVRFAVDLADDEYADTPTPSPAVQAPPV
ncbi:hypothetical protein EIP91_004979 [Steccherinum ochraceum]|uniref:Uncharacterized protein n=1 Tax=Steccherinum ochraceum TaxID=92696 RepID=A0A4R0RN52_9APHY|nr:hypothetical protein EIP91_004979 [Steccherinum ochraceum]